MGETLRALLGRGSLEVERVLEVGTQAASALAAAHEAGILHRDIKPENIMLRPDGLVKVLDFGLAKLIGRQTALFETADVTAVPVESAPGMVMGTLAYMSPEQARGSELDGRSDIFSLGAVLYELATGEQAFRGNSQMAVIAAILERDPHPLPEKSSPALAGIIERCLRKDPAQRYQTAADLKAALEDAREGSFTGRQSRSRQPRKWVRAALPSALALLLVAGFFVWRVWQDRALDEPLRAAAITTLPGAEWHPSLSPDGNQVVFSWTAPEQKNQDIYVQMIGQDSRLQLTADARDDYNPVWSPDGRWIAFFRSQPTAPTGMRSRELLLVAPLGGRERKLADIRSQDFFPCCGVSGLVRR